MFIMMNAKEIIQHACIDAHISLTSVASQMYLSRASFKNRLNTGKFTMEEWAKMNYVIGNNLVWKYMQMNIEEYAEQQPAYAYEENR